MVIMHTARRPRSIGSRRSGARPRAAPAKRPEQLRMFARADVDDITSGGDHLGFEQVIDGQPKAAHEPADTAIDSQAPCSL